MRNFLLPALAALLLTPGPSVAQAPSSAELPGTLDWSVNSSSRHEGKVQFQLRYRNANSHHIHSNSVPLTDLRGLSEGQLASAAGVPVAFRVARGAGIFDCNGVARNGNGTGNCRFVPDQAFTAALVRRGIGTPSLNEAFSLAMSNIGVPYLEELDRQRYARPSVSELVRAANHGVSLAYLTEMGGLGHRVGTLAELVRMRDHGVSAKYARELAEAGLRGLTPAALVEMRDHGVSATFAGELRALGYGELGPRELIRLRDHGVSGSFARGAREYGKFTADQLIRLRNHGVSTGYLSELRGLGYTNLTADQIVSLRSHGVSGSFIRRANAGSGRRTAEELVRLRTSG
jgi:hypothetical protein